MKKLPNLDALRFIAALLVIINHVDVGLVINKWKTTTYSLFPFSFGSLGVVLFFVLSGFLITWLLLHEKAQKNISVKRFYLKRILRIWPLYYLILIASFLVFNNMAFLTRDGLAPVDKITISHPALVFLLIIICPNVVLLFVPSLGYATVTWSIGVEEQFYLIWPHIIKKKRPEIFIVAVIILVASFRTGMFAFIVDWFKHAGFIVPKSRLHSFLLILNDFFVYPLSFQIDAMATGALGAMVAVYRKHLLSFIFSRVFQWVFYGLFAVVLFSMVDILPYQVFSVFFIVLILNLALNEKSIVTIENKFIAWLGQISYGIYLIHSITIVPAIKFVLSISGGSVNLFTELIMCLVSLGLTIAIAALSYKYFEGPFLKLKDKLSA